jgi:hypothetical protein
VKRSSWLAGIPERDRMFASMFAAWVGLGSGYILGRKSGGGDA